MQGGYAVVFRAYNQGVAYRFETFLGQQSVKIYAEESNWNFPSNFTVYYPQEDSFFSYNERKISAAAAERNRSGIFGDIARRG